MPATWSLKQLPPNLFPAWRKSAHADYGCKVSFRARRKSEWSSSEGDGGEGGPRNALVVMGSNCLNFLQDFMTALAAVGVRWQDACPLVEGGGADDDHDERQLVPITSLRIREAEWQDSVILEFNYTGAQHRLSPIQLVGWDPSSTSVMTEAPPARPPRGPPGIVAGGVAPASAAPQATASAWATPTPAAPTPATPAPPTPMPPTPEGLVERRWRKGSHSAGPTPKYNVVVTEGVAPALAAP